MQTVVANKCHDIYGFCARYNLVIAVTLIDNKYIFLYATLQKMQQVSSKVSSKVTFV